MEYKESYKTVNKNSDTCGYVLYSKRNMSELHNTSQTDIIPWKKK